eukprot:CAMPEP_0198679188 /NCGR_PEP_ID=MMETSP1468-20131203/2229_1 /TAXON_ID=1461545 /ORGANISM="Mantoniella sp, Strain CCMP1436" /LENGTH=141 /DNA_ID=CAMNT_0044417543 /DNA_START=154 /DNA_END=579 /DNA_ORIENTATION=-
MVLFWCCVEFHGLHVPAGLVEKRLGLHFLGHPCYPIHDVFHLIFVAVELIYHTIQVGHGDDGGFGISSNFMEHDALWVGLACFTRQASSQKLPDAGGALIRRCELHIHLQKLFEALRHSDWFRGCTTAGVRVVTVLLGALG